MTQQKPGGDAIASCAVSESKLFSG